jgi:uncharacterized protein
MHIDIQHVPPEGQPVERDISAESLGAQEDLRLIDRILVSGQLYPAGEGAFCLRGRMDVVVETACVRCLELFAMKLHQDLDLLYLPQSENVGPEDDSERELSDKDMAVGFYQDDKIDLKQVIWEQVYLALPMKPLCKEDCRGLCPQCGTNLNLSMCSCERETVDPRLATLKTLLKS